MAGPKWKVGILGAGYIADWHLKALRCVPEAQVVAVCDQSLARAQSLAERYRIPGAFPDIDAMLAAVEKRLTNKFAFVLLVQLVVASAIARL